MGHLREINNDYINRKNAVTQYYANRVQAFVNVYLAEGWDMESPESQEHIRVTRVNFETERNGEFDRLERERVHAVNHV